MIEKCIDSESIVVTHEERKGGPDEEDVRPKQLSKIEKREGGRHQAHQEHQAHFKTNQDEYADTDLNKSAQEHEQQRV